MKSNLRRQNMMKLPYLSSGSNEMKSVKCSHAERRRDEVKSDTSRHWQELQIKGFEYDKDWIFGFGFDNEKGYTGGDWCES